MPNFLSPEAERDFCAKLLKRIEKNKDPEITIIDLALSMAADHGVEPEAAGRILKTNVSISQLIETEARKRHMLPSSGTLPLE